MYTIMREMDLDTKLIVPLEAWQLARMYATQLKQAFGVEFKVRRMLTKRTKRNFILVERVE